SVPRLAAAARQAGEAPRGQARLIYDLRAGDVASADCLSLQPLKKRLFLVAADVRRIPRRHTGPRGHDAAGAPRLPLGSILLHTPTIQWARHRKVRPRLRRRREKQLTDPISRINLSASVDL